MVSATWRKHHRIPEPSVKGWEMPNEDGGNDITNPVWINLVSSSMPWFHNLQNRFKAEKLGIVCRLHRCRPDATKNSLPKFCAISRQNCHQLIPVFIFSALYLVKSILTLISNYKVQANDFFKIYFRYLLGLLALTACFCCLRYCFPALRVLA